VEDARGRLLAHATSRCVIQRLPFEPSEPPEGLAVIDPPSYDTPDPYLRPVEGEIVSQAVWDKTSGFDLVQLWQKGELAASPSCSLLGLRFVEVAEGRVPLAAPASLWFCTGFGTFYGGVLSALADSAISTAVTTTLPPGTSFGTLDIKVNFLRPVTPDGRNLVARATVEQRGRTITVSTARIDDADGKRVAMATGERDDLGRSCLVDAARLETRASDQEPEGHKYLRIGPVTRSFLELFDLLRLRGRYGGEGHRNSDYTRDLPISRIGSCTDRAVLESQALKSWIASLAADPMWNQSDRKPGVLVHEAEETNPRSAA
jgi:uncharacterized protein (TIGR00369 family)